MSANGHRPILLDLYCGAGGSSMGYHQAGFQVVGVDSVAQPNYPFWFLKADALDFLDHPERWPFHPAVIHASPPCQKWTSMVVNIHKNAEGYPDMIEPTRERLEKLALPYVIENIERAPLIDPIILCGTMFPGLRVIRHRKFESNMTLEEPDHPLHPHTYVTERKRRAYGRLDPDTDFITVAGGGNSTRDQAADAMQIGWMTKPELNQAIPPPYTEWIGRQALEVVNAG
jgi:DNA (cytosine-5)-methyltransferase 1